MFYTIWYLSCGGCSVVFLEGPNDPLESDHDLWNRAKAEGWEMRPVSEGRGPVGPLMEHFCSSCVRKGKS